MIRRLAPISIALLIVTLAVGCAEAERPPAPPAGTLVASPTGTGSACSTAEPCTLDRALSSARDGQSIALLDGDFGDVTSNTQSFASAGSKSIVIEPAEGAAPSIGKLDLNTPGLTWRGVTFTGGVYLDTGAVGTRLEQVHVSGSGVFVHANDVVISGALIENGTSIDGLQVGGADNLVLENSTVRGFGQGPDSDVHSDCVQLFDSSNIEIRGNYLGGGDNAAVIFSPGSGAGLQNVTVEGNFIQGCVEKTDRCSQGTAFDLRETTATGIVVRNNTMLNGSVMVEQIEGLVFDRNIIGYVSNCAMPMTNSIVIDWNTGKCGQPDALGINGNREGSINVVDLAGGDLRLVDPAQATIEPSGDSKPAAEGYDGSELDATTAGAGG